MDFSWFLVLFLIIWNLSDYYKDAAPGSNAFVLAVLSALLFFLSILLHELGHAWVAIRNGIPILGIDLWMFGGVAKLGRESTSPGVEFRIAVAGPLVTLAIAALCFALGSAISSSSDVLQQLAVRLERDGLHDRGARLPHLDQRAAARVQPDSGVPARRRADRPRHRLEGHRRPEPGHALRGHARAAWAATGWSALGAYLWLAQGRAVTGIWLAFIGFFLASAARSAEESAVFSGRIEHIRVADVMDEEPVAIREDAPVAEAERDVLPAVRMAVVPGGGLERHGSWASCPGRRSRACPARSGRPRTVGTRHGPRRRLERPARPARGAAREPAGPGGPGAVWERSWPWTARACCAGSSRSTRCGGRCRRRRSEQRARADPRRLRLSRTTASR